MSASYDVVVLGAGPGGYVAAIRASQLGLRTAVVEKEYWGGICLNIGCIPSKALLRNAEIAHLLTRNADAFGIRVNGSLEVDYSAARKRSRQVADGRANGVRYLMRKNKIDCYEGWANFRDAHNLEVQLNSGDVKSLKFRHCIIATGATPRLLPGTQLSPRVVTYQQQILAEQLPASMIIVGAGPIGVEFAYLLSGYKVDVTLIEGAERILPSEDEEVSRELAKQFQRSDIHLMTSARVDAIDDTGTAIRATISIAGGEPHVVEAAMLMQSVGFQPRTQGFGLDSTGVQLTARGAIEIDETMRTNVPHIFAIGDVTGKLMLAHVAEAMGATAAERIAGAPSVKLDYDMMPRATFCQPQVASFGFTEAQARQRGFEPHVARFPLQANGKAQGLGDATGFVKLVSDSRNGQLLGAHIIGHDVSELLPELTLAHQWRMKPLAIARNVHVHPTLGEAVMDAAHGLAGGMINV